MKKLILLFFALLTIGHIFQACSDTKTYAEMLDIEKDGVNAFINKHGINVISLSQFEAQDSTTDLSKNEYVSFSNGVYMQIVDKGSKILTDTFKTNNLIIVRFMEVDILADDTTTASNVNNRIEIFNVYPDGFRYTESGTSIYGQFIQEPGLGVNMLGTYGTSVPSGWLIPLKYVRDSASVRLIVPSKMGHQHAQQYVYPYYYDITKLTID